MFNIFTKPKQPETPKCIFCQKTTEGSELNELKYEAIDEDGSTKEYNAGLMCDRCADILDQLDEFQDMGDNG